MSDELEIGSPFTVHRLWFTERFTESNFHNDILWRSGAVDLC